MDEEGLKKTENDLIHIGNPLPLDTEDFLPKLKMLMVAAYDNDENITRLVEEVVPTYHPSLACSGQKDETYKKLWKEPAVTK